MWFQMILDCITWPSSITVILESYKVEHQDVSDVIDVFWVSGYLKTFIENGMYEYCRVQHILIFVRYCSMRPFCLLQILCCMISCFCFKHSASCSAKEPHYVLDRMGGVSHRDEGGNSRYHTSDSFTMFWKAEAAEALHSIQNISSRLVHAYQPVTAVLALLDRNNVHFKWIYIECANV